MKAPLKSISNKKFTQHRILSTDFGNPFRKGFPQHSLVWCKIDRESKLTKRTKGGLRIYNIWVVSSDFSNIAMISPNQASESLSEPLRDGKVIKALGEDINSLYLKIRNESDRLMSVRISQAVAGQMYLQNMSKKGYAYYTLDTTSLSFTNEGKKLFTLFEGDRFRIKRIAKDNNELSIDTKNYFIVDDLRLNLLVCRSK